MTYSIVTTTTSKKKEADSISNLLLNKKLAACVKLSKVDSSYIWNNKIKKSKENIVTIIAKKKNVDRIMSEIKKVHSYDVPEIIETPIKQGNKEYLRWVSDVTE